MSADLNNVMGSLQGWKLKLSPIQIPQDKLIVVTGIA